jgi:hypothetical protein
MLASGNDGCSLTYGSLPTMINDLGGPAIPSQNDFHAYRTLVSASLPPTTATGQTPRRFAYSGRFLEHWHCGM